MYKNIKIYNYDNIKIYRSGNVQIYMQKNKNVKNVKECVKKANIYRKNYKVTSNRNFKPNKEKIYKSNKYIEMCIKYIYMQTRKQTNIKKCMQKNIYLKL